jgi:hypothetical protein
MRTISTTTLLLALTLGAAATGCASDGGTGDGDDVAPSGAKLTIVGERTLALENGWSNEITVRYTDDNDQPLAGQVDFIFDGDAGGSVLSAFSGTTNADGLVAVELTAGETGELTFDIEATAEDADPVRWNVQVLQNALELTGDYRLSSDFDLATGLPGTAGTVVNTFIDMTDDPYDPATWVLDQVVANISNGTIRDLIEGARPGLDGILNELLINNTPDIVAKLIELGDAFGQIAQNFGTASTLHVEAGNDADGAMVASHILTGLIFTIDAQDYEYALTDFGMENLSATVGFSYDAQRITVGNHEFPLSYGTILMVALEQLIIPMIDGSATDLESLLAGMVNCEDVGYAVSDFLGFGSASLYEGACVLGIGYAADFVEDQIRSLDSTAMRLGIAGTARWIDNNGDRRVDVLQAGTWNGQMTWGESPAPLGPSTFRGERMLVP